MERHDFKRKYGSVKRRVIQECVVEPVVGVIVHSIGQTIVKAITVRHSVHGQEATSLLEDTSTTIDTISPDAMDMMGMMTSNGHDDEPNSKPKGRPCLLCC